MSWVTPFRNWVATSVPTPTDFNRIEGNIEYLSENYIKNDGSIPMTGTLQTTGLKIQEHFRFRKDFNNDQIVHAEVSDDGIAWDKIFSFSNSGTPWAYQDGNAKGIFHAGNHHDYVPFPQAGGLISGSVTIESTVDSILSLRQMDAGSDNAVPEGGWNYIEFEDGQGNRQGFVGMANDGGIRLSSTIPDTNFIYNSDIVFHSGNHHTYTPVNRAGDDMTGPLTVNSGGDSLPLILTSDFGDMRFLLNDSMYAYLQSSKDSFILSKVGTANFEELRLYANTSIAYGDVQLVNNELTRQLKFYRNDGTKSARAFIDHIADIETNEHSLVFDSMYNTGISYADFIFKHGKVISEKNILADGVRPITLNQDTGDIEIKGDIGGWTLGSSFKGYAGTNYGGFQAKGNGDVLQYYYIGATYVDPIMKVTPSGGGIFSGTLEAEGSKVATYDVASESSSVSIGLNLGKDIDLGVTVNSMYIFYVNCGQTIVEYTKSDTPHAYLYRSNGRTYLRIKNVGFVSRTYSYKVIKVNL